MKYLIFLLIFSFTLIANDTYKNEVLVKCIDNKICPKVLESYKFKNIEKLTNTIYLIKLDDDKDAKITSILLQENEQIKFAHPNYIKTKKRR